VAGLSTSAKFLPYSVCDRDVVALVYDGVGSFGLGVVAEVFGYDRSADGLPTYDFAVAASRPGLVRTDTGLQIVVEHGLERVATATWSASWGGRASRPSPRSRCCRPCATPSPAAPGS
jgi:hypothetical protein